MVWVSNPKGLRFFFRTFCPSVSCIVSSILWGWKGSTYSIVWFLFNPSVRRLEGDNFKLKIPPFSWEKLGSQRKLPLILLLPRLLCDKAAHLRRRPFWGMTPRLGLTWFKRAADGDSCWWMGKAMGRTHQQSWINMNIVGISLAISKMRAMNID